MTLEQYLKTQGINAFTFCRQHDIRPSTISRLLKGDRRMPSLPLALAIEKATKGMVPVSVWVEGPSGVLETDGGADR